jgi:hypothetical protein
VVGVADFNRFDSRCQIRSTRWTVLLKTSQEAFGPIAVSARLFRPVPSGAPCDMEKVSQVVDQSQIGWSTAVPVTQLRPEHQPNNGESCQHSTLTCHCPDHAMFGHARLRTSHDSNKDWRAGVLPRLAQLPATVADQHAKRIAPRDLSSGSRTSSASTVNPASRSHAVTRASGRRWMYTFIGCPP